MAYTFRGPMLSDQEGEGKKYSFLVLEIGDWDMDTDATKTVAHPYDAETIREVKAIIRNEAGTALYQLCGHNGAAMPAQVDYIDASNIYLKRAAGLDFDNASFSATGYNRGWITITHLCPGD